MASRRADESTYAGIVRLVEAAQRSRAPMSRLADRYAILFLAVTVALAGAAWALTGDPIRAVAVLVVATPCPLILAVPVAIVSGLSRAAKLGILIKGGKAIETLAARARAGHRQDRHAHPGPGPAGRDPGDRQRSRPTSCCGSPPRSTRPPSTSSRRPSSPRRAPGAWRWRSRPRWWRRRARALPDGSRAARSWSAARASSRARLGDGGLAALLRERPPGALAVAVAFDGELAGLLILSDELRAGTEQLLQTLRAIGIERIVLATGDRHEVARFVTAGLSIDQVRSELTPDQKILVVLSERKNGPVMMIGDGVNDAPALAAADIGMAMGARGAAASAEAADVVLLVDQLDRVLPAIRIARRSRSIALKASSPAWGCRSWR